MPAERLLWERLSVFSGGFDLEGAEEVCSGDGIARDEVLDLVAGLVNKSIITRTMVTDHSVVAWYDMLTTIGQYGGMRLAEAGQTREFRLRHRDYYRSLAAQWEAESFSPRQADWYIRLRREHENLRAALDFCLAEPGEGAAALEIAAPIWNFWFAGFLREGHRYLSRTIDAAPVQTPTRAKGLWAGSLPGDVPGGVRAVDPAAGRVRRARGAVRRRAAAGPDRRAGRPDADLPG